MNEPRNITPAKFSHITPAVLNEGEAARYIGMSYHYLRQSRFRGDATAPPYVKIGRSVRYMLADLDAWLQSNRVKMGGRHDS